MCGRFTQNLSWHDIQKLYALLNPPVNIEARFNIAPTQNIYAVVEREDGRYLERMRWGLIPSWWKKAAKETPATFNARAETVAEKPFFRAAFKRKRCIIPASGFYEWKTSGKEKQPYYITSKDGSVLSFAGLWDEWKDVESGEPIKSGTIIVTAANMTLRPLHDRMPVMLSEKSFAPWLRGEAGTELLKPAPDSWLEFWSVSRRVNSTRGNDDATLVERLQ